MEFSYKQGGNRKIATSNSGVSGSALLRRKSQAEIRDVIYAKMAPSKEQVTNAYDRGPPEPNSTGTVRRGVAGLGAVLAKGQPGHAAKVSADIEGELQNLRAGGQPLPADSRGFMESRLGHHFGGVRIHTNTHAQRLARDLNARAFALGNDIVFGAGQYQPDSQEGKRLMAHELTHVVQQQPGMPRKRDALGAPIIRESTSPSLISKLSAADCATDCSTEDGTTGPKGKFLITVYADKEGPFLLLPATHKVGHSWLKLVDNNGNYWIYGFWPETGYNASDTSADVEGCVHKPDTAHEPTSTQTIELTASEFAAAKDKAERTCISKPKYNLFGLQCTEFVRRVLAAAGKGYPGGFGLIWESPNALDSWLKTNVLTLGITVSGASSAKGTAGQVAFDAKYAHQFYSTLGNKLRLYGYGRTELGNNIRSLSAGVGLELNPQIIWLPTPYLEGGGITGDMNPASSRDKLGAGLSMSAGLRFNIDEIMVIGVEYNLVKDFALKDPTLNRFMLNAGFRVW